MSAWRRLLESEEQQKDIISAWWRLSESEEHQKDIISRQHCLKRRYDPDSRCK